MEDSRAAHFEQHITRIRFLCGALMHAYFNYFHVISYIVFYEEIISAPCFMARASHLDAGISARHAQKKNLFKQNYIKSNIGTESS